MGCTKFNIESIIDYALLRIQKQPLIFQAHSINLLRPRKIAFNFIRRAYYNYSVEVDGTALNGTFPSNSSIEKNELYTDYIEIAKTHSAESNVTISLTSNDRAYLLSIGLASEGIHHWCMRCKNINFVELYWFF